MKTGAGTGPPRIDHFFFFLSRVILVGFGTSDFFFFLRIFRLMTLIFPRVGPIVYISIPVYIVCVALFAVYCDGTLRDKFILAKEP